MIKRLFRLVVGPPRPAVNPDPELELVLTRIRSSAHDLDQRLDALLMRLRSHVHEQGKAQ